MIILSLLHTSHNSDRFTHLFTFLDSHLALKSTRRKHLPLLVTESLRWSSSPPIFSLLSSRTVTPASKSPTQPHVFWIALLSSPPCQDLIISVLLLTPWSIFNLLSTRNQTGSSLSNLKMKTKKSKLKLKNFHFDLEIALLLYFPLQPSCSKKLSMYPLPNSSFCLYSSTYSNLVPTSHTAFSRHIKNHSTTKLLLAFSVAVFTFMKNCLHVTSVTPHSTSPPSLLLSGSPFPACFAGSPPLSECHRNESGLRLGPSSRLTHHFLPWQPQMPHSPLCATDSQIRISSQGLSSGLQIGLSNRLSASCYEMLCLISISNFMCQKPNS